MALVFASVHPQGWTGVPVLMAMAFNFAIVREWRGSLIAPMTMHFCTNAFTLVVARAALS